ncbi:hypothetical protein K0M31_007467 [Melipona bicolor]|uniref:Uncharacterized protein n=1 Tax=Melipona bicolor TaxID=60889 RepID=A0AA40KVQ0_9HYME|nr:hypothetical protein K0M31_007467 [Melipona bicolor]
MAWLADNKLFDVGTSRPSGGKRAGWKLDEVVHRRGRPIVAELNDEARHLSWRKLAVARVIGFRLRGVWH